MRRQSENGDGSDLCEPGPPFGRPVNRSRPYFPTRSALRAAEKSLPSLFFQHVGPQRVGDEQSLAGESQP